MELYEFTYVDNLNLSETELLHRVEIFLSQEAEFQGWTSDYKVRQAAPVEQSAHDERVYRFEVIGTYLNTDSVHFDEEKEENTSSSRPAAAASDLGL